jgi:hypothetical protein
VIDDLRAGRSEMGSKSGSDVRIAKTEIPEIRIDGAKAPPVVRWLVVAVAVLSVAVIALGAALIVESGSREPAPPETAPAETGPAEALIVPADGTMVALVDRFLAAYNATDNREALASFWGKDSVLWADNPWMKPNRLVPGDTLGPRVERVSPIVQVRELREGSPVLAAFTVDFGGFTPIWVQEWSPSGDRVLAMWVI